MDKAEGEWNDPDPQHCSPHVNGLTGVLDRRIKEINSLLNMKQGP